MERPRCCEIALRMKQEGEPAEAPRRIGMLGAEHLFFNGQDAFVERTCVGKIALHLKQHRQIAEARQCPGMFWAPRLFVEGYRTLLEWPRSCIIALAVEQAAE